MDSSIIGKALILVGVFTLLLGVFLAFGSRIPWLGRLPGDIHVEREGFSLHFPLMTCILLSLLISAVLWWVGRR